MTLRILRTLFAAYAVIPLVVSCNTATDETAGPEVQQVPIEMKHQFSASFADNPGGAVTWKLLEPWAGTLDGTGLFTAGNYPARFHIVVYPAGDSTRQTGIPVDVVSYAKTTPVGIPAFGIALNGSGVLALTDNSDKVRLHHGNVTLTDSVGGVPQHVAFAPGGAVLYVTTIYHGLVKIDAATAATITQVSFPGATPYNLAVHPTTGAIYVTTDLGMIYRLDPTSLTITDSVHLASASNGLAVAGTGSDIWVSTVDTGRVYRLGADHLAIIDSFETAPEAHGLAIAPSGDSVYVAGSNGSVFILRPSTHTVTSLPLDFSPLGIAISSDGTKLLVAQYYGLVTTFDRATMTMLGGTRVEGSPRDVLTIPGGGGFYVPTVDNTILVH